ncbi:DUF928 domain-containing protein [Allocoleopsis franciscana]|uniref:DUF928 domain-containing protein n=1 Tax=Allocoleopsis franciscana PCC 7113 TaxID=1173027 RepID=K9WL43_9CYAN|nr:DUF928 domain-containing protein [Allocoleopsis franciscana]AFZ20252.1 protein of unknown function (DUF928) [Allocoleopsis franciscana PCC 7113]
MIYVPKLKLGFVTVFAIAGFTLNLAPGWTQSNAQVMADLSLAKVPLPPGTGSPEDPQKPAGTRDGSGVGACQQTDQPFTALVPKNADESLTTAEYPVFWFYIPHASEDIHSIEFSLHNQDETKTVYIAPIQLTKTPGVIGIPLPPSAKSSLKENQSYRWQLTVNCTAQTKPEDAIVLEGLVTRVEQSSNLVGVIWYDELTNRARRYLSEPQNPEVKKAWTELLKSVGLEELVQAPLVSSVGNAKKD